MPSPHASASDSPRPSHTRLQAAVSLLGDPDEQVAATVQRHLLKWGPAVRAALLAACEADEPLLRVRARATLRQFEAQTSMARFAALDFERAGRRDAGTLLQGTVLISQMARPFTPTADELRNWLRGEAELLRARFTGRSLNTCARILAEHLHGQLGFQGGDASALDMDHLLLDRVLTTRRGVPVSLSLVYLLIARWAGLSCAGVGLPDHFLVRLHGVRPLIVDPFHGGRTITKSDCVRYLKSAGHDGVQELLRDLTDREVLAHYLRAVRRGAHYRVPLQAREILGSALDHLESA